MPKCFSGVNNWVIIEMTVVIIIELPTPCINRLKINTLILDENAVSKETRANKNTPLSNNLRLPYLSTNLPMTIGKQPYQ